MLLPPVSASNSYLVPESLDLCIEGRPEYRECGTRNWAAKNFVFNANVNLQKIRDRIKQLDEGAYPRELRTIVSYFKRIQEDSLVFNSQLLKFIQEGLTEDLGKSFDGIDPMQQCGAEIAKIRSATHKNDSYRLAYYGWGNCINRGLRQKSASTPKLTGTNFFIATQFVNTSSRMTSTRSSEDGRHTAFVSVTNYSSFALA